MQLLAVKNPLFSANKALTCPSQEIRHVVVVELVRSPVEVWASCLLFVFLQTPPSELMISLSKAVFT